MGRGYRILDEPRPGALASVAVQPLWPLLAIMFGGSWLAWPWFMVNAFAVGSPTRVREVALAGGGFAGNLLLTIGAGALLAGGVVGQGGAAYLLLVVTVWKIAVSYGLYVMQSRTFGLYEYYGGTVRNGMIFLVVAYFLGRRVMQPLFDSVPALRLVLG